MAVMYFLCPPFPSTEELGFFGVAQADSGQREHIDQSRNFKFAGPLCSSDNKVGVRALPKCHNSRANKAGAVFAVVLSKAVVVSEQKNRDWVVAHG